MKGLHTEIKICGITRLEDALCAAACGADAVGFIFHPASPRCTTPDRARSIIARLPQGIVTVGVFVNQAKETVEKTVEACGIDLIQLHGDEAPAYCLHFPPERVIKAVSPRTPGELRSLDAYRVRAFLIDRRDQSRYGGTGKLADWSLAAELRRMRPLILAGGLNPGNIEEALAVVMPQAVDINSGCESAPGIKDHALMQLMIGMIRRATREKNRSGKEPGANAVFDTCVKNAFHPPAGGINGSSQRLAGGEQGEREAHRKGKMNP